MQYHKENPNKKKKTILKLCDSFLVIMTKDAGQISKEYPIKEENNFSYFLL